jgi:hypothetical protein
MGRPPRQRPRAEDFKAENPMTGFAIIAPYFWHSAELLLQEARRVAAESKSFPVTRHGAAIICLHHACLDCFLNEELALFIQPAQMSGRADQDEINKRLRSIQDLTGSAKIAEALAIFRGMDAFSKTIREDAETLISLRNLAYHHSPEFQQTNHYPPVITSLRQKLGLGEINTDWTNWLGHIAFSDWSRATLIAFVAEFDRCAGRRLTMDGLNWGGPGPAKKEGEGNG